MDEVSAITEYMKGGRAHDMYHDDNVLNLAIYRMHPRHSTSEWTHSSKPTQTSCTCLNAAWYLLPGSPWKTSIPTPTRSCGLLGVGGLGAELLDRFLNFSFVYLVVLDYCQLQTWQFDAQSQLIELSSLELTKIKDHEIYERKATIKKLGPSYAILKKGITFIWSHYLLSGGSMVNNKQLTRKS